MKKALVSAAVIAIFLAYSYHQRHETTSAQLTVVRSAATAGTSTSSAQNLQPTTSGSPSPTPAGTGKYKDGSYTGDAADAFYGNIQVRAVVQNGKLATVEFLQYPNENHTSQAINSQAMPILQTEAIAAQSAKVDMVTGATDTSTAFIQSLTSALAHAV